MSLPTEQQIELKVQKGIREAEDDLVLWIQAAFDKRRQEVYDLLKGYGKWVQDSVFECVLTRAKYNELKERLSKKVKLEEDSVRLYPLSGHTLGQVEIWGVGPPVSGPPRSVIIQVRLRGWGKKARTTLFRYEPRSLTG